MLRLIVSDSKQLMVRETLQQVTGKVQATSVSRKITY